MLQGHSLSRGLLQLAVAAAPMACALLLTHALWDFLRHTPFLLGFAAAIVSSRFGGTKTGFLSVILGTLGYLLFPPAFENDDLLRLLAGFVIVSGGFCWLVGRRYQFEAALRSSESRLVEAHQLAQLGAWEWDLRDDSEAWSPEVYRIFGLEPGSVEPSFATFSRFLHPDDRGIVDRVVKQALEDHQPFQCDNRIVRGDGEIRTLHVQGRVVVDDRGRVTRLVGVAQDITEQKRAQEAVTRSERRLQAIIAAEPACVKLVSRQGRLLDMNRAGLDMIGADSVEQVAGHLIADLVHPDDRAAFIAMHRSACDGSSGRLKFRIVGLNGQERWVDSHVVPFEAFTAGGEVQAAVLSVTSDITEHKRLEDELRQAHKMEAVGLLAGGIAHDFNNMLTAIGGYTDMVLDTFDAQDPRREELQEVANAASRAAALTRQLLAFSRRQILQPTVLDLNEMAAGIQRLLRRTIRENIDVQLDLGRSLEPVRADRVQLEQVVLNLAINASDAMPHGGNLRLSTSNADIDARWPQSHRPMPLGRYVRLTVSDTGVGMSPETQARIFEPFFTTKPRGEGTGLGLATVYGIIKQSEGFIWVESELGRGTTFDVYLPAARAAIARSMDAPATVHQGIGSHTILLAEDDGAVRRLARDVLTHHGYTVVDAGDGEEALRFARQYQGRIDLLIADVVMPGMSGRDLAERLTAERPDARVLYTSGYTDNVMARAGFEQGLLLLPKPFLPADLLRRVGEVLAGTAR